jgi:hypothetical protein
MKNTDPEMSAKLKSKTHLQNMFFDFLSRLKKSKRCQKTQNFMLILNPLKKLLKNAPKKLKAKQV